MDILQTVLSVIVVVFMVAIVAMLVDGVIVRPLQLRILRRRAALRR